MKLLAELQKHVGRLGDLHRAWFTSFNTDIEFVERHVLPAALGANTPRNRLEYEQLQQELTTREIDFRIFCDPRFLETHRIKRTCIPVHGIRPQRARNGDKNGFSKNSLFHPKVIYLEGRGGRRVIGAGSANLTASGWGLNLEAFRFFEVKSSGNYREIRSFFQHLCDAADIDCNLDARPRFYLKEEPWRFIHSFQETPFPAQLLPRSADVDLAVWSPYLPQDLEGLMQRLRSTANVEKLRVHLVADRSAGHVRTGWSQALAKLQKSGELSFRENPAHLDTRMKLCHAKIWKVAGKLAIGSWNFTGPGSNSLRKDSGGRHPDNNVEAGFIIDDNHDWRQVCGDAFAIGQKDCATPQELEEEGLVVDPLPPFDLHVSFNWRTQAYCFKGQWIEGRPETGYEVCLPGVAKRCPLEWNNRNKPFPPIDLAVEDRSLLEDRSFRVFRGKTLVMSGIVSELQTAERRAQHFESLEDLLDALALGDDAADLGSLPFRIPLLDTDTFPDDTPQGLHPACDEIGQTTDIRAPLSYFRLFQSTHALCQKLQSLEKLEQLDRQVFVWPGCLQELVDKVREEIKMPGREVFHWFLVKELNWLYESAHAMRRKLVHGRKQREPRYEPVPESRWRGLQLDPLKLPAVKAGYLEHVEQQWRQHV